MGMYTEFVFGCTFKEDTPDEIIEYVREMLDTELRGSSYYTGYPKRINSFSYDKIARAYILAIRCSIKNYSMQIEDFIKKIKPYIDSGSGSSDFLGYYVYEESEKPTLIYL